MEEPEPGPRRGCQCSWLRVHYRRIGDERPSAGGHRRCDLRPPALALISCSHVSCPAFCSTCPRRAPQTQRAEARERRNQRAVNVLAHLPVQRAETERRSSQGCLMRSLQEKNKTNKKTRSKRLHSISALTLRPLMFT